MKLRLAIAVGAAAFAAGCTGTFDSASVDLSRLAVVSSDGNGVACRELLKHLELVSGSRPTEEGDFRIYLGRKAPDAGAVEDFTSYAKRVGNALYLWGDDAPTAKGDNRPGTLFAVYGFLGEALGVRWIGPGDDGIVCSRKSAVRLPDGWLWKYRPPLLQGQIRVYRYKKERSMRFVNRLPPAMRPSEEEMIRDVEEGLEWRLRTLQYNRDPDLMGNGHAFTDWNGRFYKTHPEYLALFRGYRGASEKDSWRARWVKLCVSNEAVVDQVISDWVAKGKQKVLNICQNDWWGYCTCTSCCALDCPPYESDERKSHKTDRMVNFWNRVMAKAVALRPDVSVCAYAYAANCEPPRREMIRYPENLILGIVPITEQDNEKLMQGWRQAGLRRFVLRPNYLTTAGALPLGYERYYYENFKMNLKYGMVGCDYDHFAFPRLVDFPRYVLARVMSNPDLPFEAIEDEYLSQYGAARTVMREYHVRIRSRSEKVLRARQKSRRDGQALDETFLYGAELEANPRDELEKDLEIVRLAEAVPELTAVERKRVAVRRLSAEHALKTRDFLLARDGESHDRYLEIAKELLDYRCRICHELKDDWISIFRRYPCEAKWWSLAADGLRETYPDMAFSAE